MTRRRLLVVDDDEGIRIAVRRIAQGDFEVLEAPDAATGRLMLLESIPDVLVTDLVMPGGGGAELARWALARLPDLAVVVITGQPTLPIFVDLFRVGVADFLTKPFRRDDFERSILRALQVRRLRRENAALRGEVAQVDPLERLVGESAAMAEVRQRIRLAAATSATVLVTGSSGTGKELVARAVHALSPRHAGPLVAVHCGALSSGLVESELFGHARGAFTGAAADRRGRFEEASGGTIFLDEIGTMNESAQARLLRVLQDRSVVRVGETRQRAVDVRVVAATNADLPQLVRAGRFREDLYFRLDVVTIELPDLAQRGDDILLLASHLLDKACRRMGRPGRTLSQDAARRLLAHAWPGNVRELENVMEAAVINAGPRDVVLPEDLLLGADEASRARLPPEGIDLAEVLARREADLVRQALERTRGNVADAARLLRASRTTLARKVRQLEARERPSP